MSKLFRIEEADLCELEAIIPQLADVLAPQSNNRIRVQLRRCKAVLSNVRWGYGPAEQVRIIPAGNADADQPCL